MKKIISFKLFENIHSDSYNKRIKDSIQKIKSDFKSDTDSCVHYLMDEFPTSVNIQFGSSIYNVKSDEIIGQYKFKVNPDQLEKFEEECRCSIDRLVEMGIRFSIEVSFERYNDEGWSGNHTPREVNSYMNLNEPLKDSTLAHKTLDKIISFIKSYSERYTFFKITLHIW